MSYAKRYRRYLRWMRYIDRYDECDVRRTMGYVRALSGAMRREPGGFYRMPMLRRGFLTGGSRVA